MEAAGQEPVYQGAATLVVPLYIPEGAVPISLARNPRSGSKDSFVSISSDSGASTSIRLPSVRRSRLASSVTSRRQGGPRRPQSPTQSIPLSFLGRGWGRRTSPRATSRVGVHDDSDSDASASQQSHVISDNQNQNNRVTNFSNNTDQNSSLSNLSIVPPVLNKISTDQSSNFVGATTIAPTTITTSTETIFTIAPMTTLSRKSINTTTSQNISSSDNLSPSETNLSVISTIPNSTVKVYEQNSAKFSVPKPEAAANSTNSSDFDSDINKKDLKNGVNAKNGDRRPIPLPKPVQDILGHSSRSHRTTTVETPAESEDVMNTADEKYEFIDNIGKSPRSKISLTSRTIADDSIAASIRRSEIIKEDTNENIAKRRLPFPPRPTMANQTSSEKKETFFNVSDAILQTTPRSVSKLRLPVLNRKASLSGLQNTSSVPYVDNNTKTYVPLDILPNVTEAKLESSAPLMSVPIPVRRRRPLRTQLGTVQTKNPVPNFSSLSTIPTTATPTVTEQTVMNITANNITIYTIPFTEKSAVAYNLSTTTASSIRRIHDFFQISANNDGAPGVKQSAPHKTVDDTAPRVSSSTTPSALIFPSTNHWPKPTEHSRSAIRGANVGMATINPKSPAEIVLASLSEVMREATTRDRDKFKEIATDLDTLNKQLAERGILIIHAEIDGRIIKLRNHTKSRNGSEIINRDHIARLDNYDQDNDKFNESEKERLHAQSLSSTDDTITTIFTPSDKLEYDIVLKNDDGRRRSHDGSLSSTYYNIQNGEDQSEKFNEVSTTKFNKIGSLTTNKPSTIKADRSSTTSVKLANSTQSELYLSNRKNILASNNRARFNSRMQEKSKNQSSLLDLGKSRDEAAAPQLLDGDFGGVSSTPSPRSVNADQGTTVAPALKLTNVPNKDTKVINTNIQENPAKNIVDNGHVQQNIMESNSTLVIAPTSHMRPANNVAESSSNATKQAASASSVGKKLSPMLDELLRKNANESETDILTSTSYDNINIENLLERNQEDPSVDSSGDSSSSVYLVGMVGIFPLAGVAAYVVRRFLRGDSSHQKPLPESEERPDGFTPPTHHHPRTHSLLPVSLFTFCTVCTICNITAHYCIS